MPETISQINIRESFKKNGIPAMDGPDGLDGPDGQTSEIQCHDARSKDSLQGISATGRIFRDCLSSP